MLNGLKLIQNRAVRLDHLKEGRNIELDDLNARLRGTRLSYFHLHKRLMMNEPIGFAYRRPLLTVPSDCTAFARGIKADGNQRRGYPSTTTRRISNRRTIGSTRRFSIAVLYLIS